MKKLFVLFVILSPLAVVAQVSKGNVFLGGSIQYANVSVTGGGSGSAVEFDPRIGFMLNDNNALGGGLNISSSKAGDVKSNSLGVAFFHRYYKPVTESFFFVLHSEVSFDFGKTTPYAGAPDIKTNEFSLSTGPRFAYFASKHWSFEASIGQIGYTSTSQKPDGGTSSTQGNFFLNAGSVGLGVYYYISK